MAIQGIVITKSKAMMQECYADRLDLSWVTDPYILIGTRDGLASKLIFLFSEKPIVNTFPSGTSTNGTFKFAEGTSYLTRLSVSDNGIVGSTNFPRGSSSAPSFFSVTSSNFDIYDKDGNLYFENSNLSPESYSIVISGFEFAKVWSIKEGMSYPKFLRRGEKDAIEGLPGESMRNYVFVEKADDGTMFYQGEIYKTLGMNNLISKFVGEPGEVVSHPWGGERQRARDGKTYVYLASGVQDPDYPGGYGTYLPDTNRTVALRADRSINVNFYYIAAGLPEYNYLMRVSVPDGGFHIAILKENVSDIKLKMPDGSICTVDIVTLEDAMASDIRVSLPTGIFALKKVVLSD